MTSTKNPSRSNLVDLTKLNRLTYFQDTMFIETGLPASHNMSAAGAMTVMEMHFTRKTFRHLLRPSPK